MVVAFRRSWDGKKQQATAEGQRKPVEQVEAPRAQVRRRLAKVWDDEQFKATDQVSRATRWGFGLSAVGAAAAIMIFFGLAAPGAQAKAAQLMAKGA